MLSVLSFFTLPAFTQTAKLRYMPLGDSITDYGCWRPWLAQKLQEAGHPVPDFVGSRKAEANCNNLNYDRDHEGHPGHQAADIVSKKQLVDWLKQNPADIVTMHLGTCDIVLANRKTPDVITALGTLVDQMRTSNPKMRIIVWKIFPQRPTICS